MNSFLISVGAAIVVVLIAAFVGPAFIDWNSYSGRIEDEARRVLCREVRIDGNVDVRLLPNPVVTTGEVEVAGVDGETLASAAGITLSLDLGTLLTGGIEVTALELDRPVFALGADADGRLNWAAAPTRGCATDLASVNFRRIDIINGRFGFATAGMAAPRVLDRVEGTVTAGGPSGPYKFAGTFADGEERLGFTLSSGRINPGATTRVSGRIALDASTEASFDGVAEGWSVPPHYAGTVRLARTLETADGETVRLAAASRAELGIDGGALSDLELSVTRGDVASSAAGSARIDLSGEAPRLALDLRARRIDIDQIFLGKGATQRGVAAILGAADRWVAGSGATGRVSFGVEGALYRDELVQDLTASINLGRESLGIETLKATLPGQSEFGFTGSLVRGGGDKLVGTLVLNTRDIRRLLAWAVPPAEMRFARLMPETHGRLSLTGGLAAERGAIEMTGIEGLLDGSTFSGDIGFDLDGAGGVHAALAFDELDLDRVVPEAFEPLALLAGRPVAAGEMPEIGLEIAARRARWRGREGRGLSAAGLFAGDRLTLERLHLDDLAGARIELSGAAALSAEGPTGAIELALETRDLPALAQTLGSDLGRLAGRGPEWLALIRDGRLEGRLEARREGEAWTVSAEAGGTVGGTEVSVSASSDAAPAHVAAGRVEGALRLASADAGRLFGQVGLAALGEPTPNEAGEITFDAVGSVETGFGYSARFRGFEAEMGVEGSIDAAPARVRGHVSLRAADSNRIADLLGLGASAPVLPATDVAADIDLKGGGLEVTGVTGRIAGVEAAGRARLRIAGERGGEIEAELGQLSLPWALASLFGGGAESTLVPPPGPEALWSTGLVRASALDGWPLTLSLRAGRLTLAGDLGLDEGRIEAEIGKGRLRLEGLTGTLDGGGRFRLAGEITRSDLALGIDGEIEAGGLPLGSYFADAAGRPLLVGGAGIDMRFTATGRSLLSLVSSLAGEGTATLADATLPRLDAGGLLGEAGKAESPERAAALIDGARRGETALALAPSPIEAESGRLSIGPSEAKAGGLAGDIATVVDLVGGRLDQEIRLSADGGARLSVVHSGSFADIGRGVEVSGAGFGAARSSEPVTPPPDADPEPSPVPQPDPDIGPADLSQSGRTGRGDGPPARAIEQETIDLPMAGGGAG